MGLKELIEKTAKHFSGTSVPEILVVKTFDILLNPTQTYHGFEINGDAVVLAVSSAPYVRRSPMTIEHMNAYFDSLCSMLTQYNVLVGRNQRLNANHKRQAIDPEQATELAQESFKESFSYVKFSYLVLPKVVLDIPLKKSVYLHAQRQLLELIAN